MQHEILSALDNPRTKAVYAYYEKKNKPTESTYG